MNSILVSNTATNATVALRRTGVPTLATFKQFVRAILDIDGEFVIHYTDDEGDQVRVCTEAEYREALSISGVSKLVFLVTPTSSTSSSSSSSSSVDESNNNSNNNMSFDIPIHFLGQLLNQRINVPISHPFTGFPISPPPAPSRPLREPFSHPISPPSFRHANAAVPPHPVHSVHQQVASAAAAAAAQRQQQQQQQHSHRPIRSTAVVHAATCDGCSRTIVGVRYKCGNCADYDLCERCEQANVDGRIHSLDHVFLKLGRRMHSIESTPLLSKLLFKPRTFGHCSVVRPINANSGASSSSSCNDTASRLTRIEQELERLTAEVRRDRSARGSIVSRGVNPDLLSEIRHHRPARPRRAFLYPAELLTAICRNRLEAEDCESSSAPGQTVPSADAIANPADGDNNNNNNNTVDATVTTTANEEIYSIPVSIVSAPSDNVVAVPIASTEEAQMEEEDHSEALNALKAMGIEEEIAQLALRETEGNLNDALAIIFGDDQ